MMNDSNITPIRRKKRAKLAPPPDAELAVLSRIIPDSSATNLSVSNYQEDEAVRHAMFNAPKAKTWPTTDNGAPRYRHRRLNVTCATGDDAPMTRQQAIEYLLTMRESTVLTTRIVLGLWNQRRYQHDLCVNGDVGIRIDDILTWRGFKKSARGEHSNGWHMDAVNAVRDDLQKAASIHLEGQHPIYKRGKLKGWYVVNSQYIRASYVYRKNLWGDEELAGVFVSPGTWIQDYEHAGNYFLTSVEREIFRLNPQNEQHEVKIALFLAELWRKQANDREYTTPIAMESLLRESVIDIDRPNLTSRFAPRIERAFANLQKRGIIGPYECLTQVDKSRRGWGKDWLASQWRILPPTVVENVLEDMVRHGLPAPKAA